MRSKRSRLGRLGVLALVLGVFAGTGVAQAAKVSETVSGGPVPDAVDIPGGATIQGLFTQTFELEGKKLKKRQTLDVNLIVNAAGSTAGALGDLRATLVGPKGDNDVLSFPGFGTNWVNLEFDQQSIFQACNPLVTQASDCNYVSGGNAAGTTGTMTGALSDGLNQEFKGTNPKGTWTLHIWDMVAGGTSVMGETTLRLKTGRKFAKEAKKKK